jgi:hypothetical protein
VGASWSLVSHSQHQSLLVVHSLKERHLVTPTGGYISCWATWLSHHSVCTRPDPGPARLPARADNDWSTFYLLHKNASWAQVYETEPLANITEPAQRALVLGAEVRTRGGEADASTFGLRKRGSPPPHIS